MNEIEKKVEQLRVSLNSLRDKHNRWDHDGYIEKANN